ncbi:MAG: ABC transporter ATP-binding protein [Lachnospiraceae bacterium]|nr:ABC transporter ATP-binding protein [Lachnospiraceae bacterium]
MSTIIAKGINKKYKDTNALKDVDLTVESGKIYGMIGRNGAGKTTLLSILSAQNPATSGLVTIDGEKVWENQKAIDRICFSREIATTTPFGPNTYKIKDYLKAAEIFYPNWDKEYAKNLVETFKLNPRKKVSKLSKGMLSMVTIIIALASRAEFTFLDEPVAGLDIVARDQFYKLLLKDYEETHRTFIISTHIIEEAANLFEDTIIVKNGEIYTNENTQQLLARVQMVSGSAEEVDALIAGRDYHRVEQLGNTKRATIVMRPGEELKVPETVTVTPLSLQEIFLAVCGEEVEQ